MGLARTDCLLTGPNDPIPGGVPLSPRGTPLSIHTIGWRLSWHLFTHIRLGLRKAKPTGFRIEKTTTRLSKTISRKRMTPWMTRLTRAPSQDSTLYGEAELISLSTVV